MGILAATQLTHEVYRQSMGALQSGTVFASGPAGTGKTETQKDFSRLVLGRSSCVFNCSDTWDTAMVQTISTLLTVLPDTVFILDESNRVPIDVLTALLQACVALGGSRSMSVAFTFNPGYKGRSALPEL